MIRFQCRCGKKLSVPADQAGQQGRCSNCGATLTVPELATDGGQESEGNPVYARQQQRRRELCTLPPDRRVRNSKGQDPLNRPEGHGESIHAVDYAKIVEAVVKDHAHSEGLFLGDVLSAKKERNARRTCGIPDDARIVALIDCTVFGSAKNCLVFTEWGVYCHNDWTGRSSGKI